MDTIKRAVSMALRPLVRYLIGQGTTYVVLCRWLKTLYVQEALSLAQPSTSVVTDSQVALLSGVHRKDVARLRREPDAPLRPSQHASVAARVVAEWVSSTPFLNAEGFPRTLALKAPAGISSFDTLVRLVKADLRANVVLGELERAGVAARTDDGGVRLVRNAYISDLPEEKLEFFGANVGDHVASVVHNLTEPAPYLERAVYYDRIPVERLDAARAQLVVLAERFLRDTNERLMPLDGDPMSGPSRRVRIGVYYYQGASTGQPESEISE